jgi:phospholipase B1
MKSFLIGLSLILVILNGVKSLKRDEYVSAIGDLLTNKQFIEEYEKWSLKLFSDPDYLYGPKPTAFPCQIPATRSEDVPVSVHNLTPKDIQCVGAIGDSLTAALGAHAATPIGLFTENRGVSWSVGGDYTYDDVLTLPNILRQYNPNIKGFSVKNSIIFLGGQNSSNNFLNTAESGDEAHHMPDQSHIFLQERIVKKGYCDLNNDWKIITLFVGGNDLCVFCNNDLNAYNPTSYANNIEQTLDYLHQNVPRAFVNLVLVLDVRNVEKLNAGGLVCQLLHQKTCPCAAFPQGNDSAVLDEWLPQYHSKLVDLVNSGKYDTKDDFTVVIQPFFAHTGIPIVNGEIDYGYFAPDCFHMSGKGHAQAALSLWNNMLEPVGQKQWEWHYGEPLECPTQDRPFFATRKNSPQSFEKIPLRK